MLNQEDEQQESVTSMMYRASINAFHRTEILCRKTERNAKLAVKKLQLRQVKKTFGVDYMTLLEKEANPDQLDQCLRDGHEKMGNINKDIRSLRAEKASLDELLQQKLVRKAAVTTSTENESTAQQHSPELESQKASAPPENAVKEGVESDNELRGEHEDEAGDGSLILQNVEQERAPSKLPLPGRDLDQEDDFVVLPETREKS